MIIDSGTTVTNLSASQDSNSSDSTVQNTLMLKINDVAILRGIISQLLPQAACLATRGASFRFFTRKINVIIIGIGKKTFRI